MLLRILFLALLIYVGLALVIFLFQARLVFLPHVAGRDLVATPAQLGLAFDDVELQTADGERLHGWWLPHDQARGTLLFFHGNAGNISHRLESLQIFHELGLNVLIFDYRGYGLSSGRPSEQGVYEDARTAWRWLIEDAEVDAASVLLFGRSMGGAVAARLASEVSAAGLIVESSFSSIVDIASEYYGWLPVRWLTRIQFPTAEWVAEAEVPVLVVHSLDDEIVRFEHARRILEAAGERGQLLEIEGDHNTGFLRSRAAYQAGLERFMSVLNLRPARSDDRPPE